MSELQVHDLRFESVHEITEFARIEAARLEHRIKTDGRRPMGLRLSTDCPVRRVLEFIDDSYHTPIHPGVADRGHQMESHFRVKCGELIETWQPPIQWACGISAFDYISVEGHPVDIKSAIKSGGPSTGNKRQADRMLTAAGYEPGQRFGFMMISPSSMQAVGEYEHTLTAENHARVLGELAAVERAHNELTDVCNDWHYWHALGLACTCGACVDRRDPIDANDPLEKIATKYAVSKASERASAERVEAYREQLREAATILLQTRENTTHGRIRTHWSPLTISISKMGRLTIREGVTK